MRVEKVSLKKQSSAANGLSWSGQAVTKEIHQIPHNDVSLTDLLHIDCHSSDTTGALGMVLHHLASTMCEISLEHIFGLIILIVTCYFSFSSQILLHILDKIPSGRCCSARGLRQWLHACVSCPALGLFE